MTYREMLERTIEQKNLYIHSMQRPVIIVGSNIDEATKRLNEARMQIRIREYDREIDRLQKLVYNEIEEEAYKKAFDTFTLNSDQIYKSIEKGLKDAFK